MSFINKVSIATIIMAIVNIAIVVYLASYEVSYVSALFGWFVVVTSQLSLISVRLASESK